MLITTLGKSSSQSRADSYCLLFFFHLFFLLDASFFSHFFTPITTIIFIVMVRIQKVRNENKYSGVCRKKTHRYLMWMRRLDVKKEVDFVFYFYLMMILVFDGRIELEFIQQGVDCLLYRCIHAFFTCFMRLFGGISYFSLKSFYFRSVLIISIAHIASLRTFGVCRFFSDTYALLISSFIQFMHHQLHFSYALHAVYCVQCPFRCE